MKLILLHLIAALLIAAPAPAPGAITMDAAWSLTAGETWSLLVKVDGAAVGSTVDATVINGLRRYDTRLTLGTGGVGLWDIPAGTILSAGHGLVLVRSGGVTVRHTLIVLPASVAIVEALTTANILPAYGDARGIVMALAADPWGNAPQNWTSATVTADYPYAEAESYPLRYTSGLFWTWLPSHSSPGRLATTLTVDGVADTLEIRQVPSDPSVIRLSASVECLEQIDEREVLTLTARVVDAHGSPVSDGTIIRFTWGDGNGGAASVLNGHAVLELPAQVTVYQALTANAASNRVQIGAC